MALKRSRKRGWARFPGALSIRALIEKRRAKDRPEIVPMELTGKWVVWTPDGRKIVGSGDTPKDAEIAAENAGVRDGLFEWIPRVEQLRSTTRREVKTNP